MATYDDILGNGSGTPFPKGSKEWHEQQQDGSSASPPVIPIQAAVSIPLFP